MMEVYVTAEGEARHGVFYFDATFKVGDTADFRINRKPARVTWRDLNTLVIEPGDARRIVAIDRGDDLISFACTDADGTAPHVFGPMDLGRQRARREEDPSWMKRPKRPPRHSAKSSMLQARSLWPTGSTIRKLKRAPDDHPLFEVAQTVFEAALFVRAPYEWDEEEE
jgi:hypothetical protein